MKISHKIYILYIILFLFPCLAESRGVGTSGNAFLKIGVGARSASMGEASVAVVNDVSSIYWNPAGLVQIRSSQISAMHIEWFDDIRYEWIGFAQPLTSRATIAADVSYIYTGAIPRTIESSTEGYEEDGTFSPVNMAGRIAFGARVLKNLFVGGSFQRIQSKVSFNDVTKEKIGDKTAQSMSIDLGCVYNIPGVNGLSAGLCFQNMGKQTRAFVAEKEPMPFALNLGAAYKTLVAAGRPSQTESVPPVSPPKESSANKEARQGKASGSLIVAMDIVIPADNSINARMGAEYRFGNGVALRGGYRTGTGFTFPSGLSAGMGYESTSYQVDYAFIPYGNLGNTHRMSFTIRF